MRGDVLARDAGRLELGAVDGGKIQMEPPAAGGAQELTGELRGDLAAHLVAAGPDRGAEPGAHGARVGAEIPQRRDGADRGCVLRRAAPARVRRRRWRGARRGRIGTQSAVCTASATPGSPSRARRTRRRPFVAPAGASARRPRECREPASRGRSACRRARAHARAAARDRPSATARPRVRRRVRRRRRERPELRAEKTVRRRPVANLDVPDGHPRPAVSNSPC